MKLKLTKSVDSYISLFRELIEICQTPISEVYLFSFSVLFDGYKEEFTKQFPTGSPPSMQDVFEHARTIEIAMQWDTKPTRYANSQSTKSTEGAQWTRKQET